MDLAHSPVKAVRPSVLFVTGLERPEDGSRVYRCTYQAKQLRNAGLPVSIVFDDDASLKLLDSADIVIMARCKMSAPNLALARAARGAGKVLFGDLDDKIFEPWDVHTRGALRSRPLGARDDIAIEKAIAGERSILGLLPLFDRVITSTPGLKDALEELGIPAHVARNALDTDVAIPMKREPAELRSLLVMSGTRTHDADLRLIAAPLARFLYENPSIVCTFLGPLSLAGPLRGLANVQTKDKLPLAELYPFIAKHDLCLVPLEDSLFNDCKSAIKFLECGVVSVPVVASPRREFRDLIRDGETGFLASDDFDAWYRMLCRLRDNPGLLRKVARNAHHEVLKEHTVAARGSVLADFLSSAWDIHTSSVRAIAV